MAARCLDSSDDVLREICGSRTQSRGWGFCYRHPRGAGLCFNTEGLRVRATFLRIWFCICVSRTAGGALRGKLRPFRRRARVLHRMSRRWLRFWCRRWMSRRWLRFWRRPRHGFMLQSVCIMPFCGWCLWLDCIGAGVSFDGMCVLLAEGFVVRIGEKWS